MRFAELFLRLGSSLVAWMVLYAYVLWLAVLRVIGCGPDGDELHRLLLGVLPFAIGATLLLRAADPFDDIQKMLRWLGLPLLLLMPFAARSTWDVAAAVLIQSGGICSSLPPTWWQQAWAPLQIMTLAFIAFRVIQAISSSR